MQYFVLYCTKIPKRLITFEYRFIEHGKNKENTSNCGWLISRDKMDRYIFPIIDLFDTKRHFSDIQLFDILHH